MTLYFVDGENESFVKNVSNEKEVYQEINKFCNENNFHLYYVRRWESKNGIMFDFGNHTKFFRLI